MPPEQLPPAEGEAAEGGGAHAEAPPDPLEGFHLRPGRRGPATTLTEEMIHTIAEALARYGVKRIAAAKAGTTEDCLDAWLRRGADAAKRRKRSLYTQLYAACEEAMAHRAAYLIELGDKTVMDRHTNPRWVTWALAVTAPKQFTVPKEGPAKASGQLGPAFEMVTPAQAAASLEEKLAHFLATEARVEKILAEAAEPRSGEAGEGGA
jgi:hypothetical protein